MIESVVFDNDLCRNINQTPIRKSGMDRLSSIRKPIKEDELEFTPPEA